MFQDKKHSQRNAGSGPESWADPASCRRASAEEGGKLFENFRTSAFRLETLDEYLVASELPQFQAYLAGDNAKNNQNREWASYIAEQSRQGKAIERVHIIPTELTDYLKFEFDWAYRYNQLAGETIHLAYRETLPRSLQDLRLPDFWLFDDSQCLVQRYDKAGAWIGSDILLSNEGIQTLRTVRDELLKICFPLKEHPHVRW